MDQLLAKGAAPKFKRTSGRARLVDGRVRLYTKGGYDWAERYPSSWMRCIG